MLSGAIELTTYIMTISCFQVYWQHPRVLCLIICFAYISMLSISFYFASSLCHSKKPLQNGNLSGFRKEIRTGTLVYVLHYKNLRTALFDNVMLHLLSNLYNRGSKGLFPHERTWLPYLPPVWKLKAHVKILQSP